MIKTRKAVLISILLFVFHSSSFAFITYSDSAGVNSAKGKIIKNIYINNIDVSGPSINDGEDWKPDIFGKIGNALHFKTKAWVIKNILLFKEGEKLDPQSVEDSERLLRESGYFYDAAIVTKDSDQPGNINVYVSTKDKWTLNPQISYSPKRKSGYFGLRDNNFIGIGNSAGFLVTHDDDPYIGWGGKFDYTMNNIKGSFVNASLNLASNNKSNLFQIGLDRSFITTRTLWAGGIDFTWEHDDLRYLESNNKITLIPHSYDSQDLWVGRSFTLPFVSENVKRNSSFILSGRYYRKHYRLRPKVTPDSNKIFENHRLYLVSLGAINRKFYKSYYVSEFGVTEDIPIGGMITLTTGSDSREFHNRWYYGMQLIYSSHMNRIGYFSGNLEVGGFRYSNKWEQNTIKFDLIYHSPLVFRDGWKARFFVQNNFVLGLNRFQGEQIFLDRNTGMPGFNEFSIAGVKRNVLDLEMRLFTPYNILGFVIGGIAFADYALISGENQNLLGSRVYQGYGFGLRTRNQSISKTNFELALVYNPYNPVSGGAKTEIIFSAVFVLGSRNFNSGEPSIINFSDE